MVRLLNPKSIAIVGASDKPGSFGQRVAGNLEYFDGAVHYVNPRAQPLFGQPSYATLSDLPEVPDCVIMAAPANTVEPTVEEAIRLGIGGMVIFAAGYSETGTPENIARQQRLTDMVRGTGTRIVGPNCIGVLNYLSNARMAFSRQPARTSPLDPAIGIVCQSGAVGAGTAQSIERGVSVAYALTAGNACDVDPADYIAFLAEEPACKAIACAFEGLTDIERFIEAADIAWAADKPLVVFKMATGERGAAAALSHTGSLAGSDAAYRAMFERAGVVQVQALEDLVETTAFLAKAPRTPKTNGVAIVSTTGGGAVIAADFAERNGIWLPHFKPETEAYLESYIPEFGSAKNPCDLTAEILKKPEALRHVGEAVAREETIGAMVLPHPLADPNVADRPTMLGEIARAEGKAMAVVWMNGWQEGPGTREAEAHPDVGIFRTMDRCFAALQGWHLRGDRKQRRALGEARLTAAGVNEQVGAALASAGANVVGETEAKALLGLYGIPAAAERLVQDRAGVDAAIGAIGFPMAMKIESPDIPHKTEAGMVKLNIASAEAAHAAFADIMDRAAAMAPRPQVSGVVMQAMVPQGLELVIGGRVDPLFGPMIVFGFGGVLVELLRDTITLLAPVSPSEVKAQLQRLKGAKLFDGFRGAPPVDLDALARVIAGASEFLADQADRVAEFDVNPLIVTAKGLVAVDALIVLKGEGAGHGA